MLNQGWRSGLALLAAPGIVPARRPARRRWPWRGGCGRKDRRAESSREQAPADSIEDGEQWVLSMLNAEAAWSVTRGAGVTVAVIDSGVNPHVSDLSGSVITGPDYTGVTTSPADGNWGVHGPGFHC